MTIDQISKQEGETDELPTFGVTFEGGTVVRVGENSDPAVEDSPLADPEMLWPRGVVEYKFHQTFPRYLNIVTSPAHFIWLCPQWTQGYDEAGNGLHHIENPLRHLRTWQQRQLELCDHRSWANLFERDRYEGWNADSLHERGLLWRWTDHSGTKAAEYSSLYPRTHSEAPSYFKHSESLGTQPNWTSLPDWPGHMSDFYAPQTVFRWSSPWRMTARSRWVTRLCCGTTTRTGVTTPSGLTAWVRHSSE